MVTIRTFFVLSLSNSSFNVLDLEIRESQLRFYVKRFLESKEAFMYYYWGNGDIHRRQPRKIYLWMRKKEACLQALFMQTLS